jgi:hypothetical protein
VTPARKRAARAAGHGRQVALSSARGRRRDYAREYARRAARARGRGSSFYAERVARGAERGLSRSAAAGHAREGEESVAARSAARLSDFPVFERGGSVHLDVPVTRGETVRLGNYFMLLRLYERGDVSASEFRRRVSGWRPVAGYRLEADADVALAMAASMTPEDWRFDYRHGRAGRAT